MLANLATILGFGFGFGSAWGKNFPRPQPTHRLQTARLDMRLPVTADWWEWWQVRSKNRAYLTPWEPAWGTHALTHKFFSNYVRRAWRDWRLDRSYNFLIFPKGCDKHHKPIGGITISDVARGKGNTATLGYWMCEAYAGRGLMTEAVQALVQFAFEDLGLSMLEASCLPHNEASRRVLQKTDFHECGYALCYMQINGKLEDHILWRKIRNQEPEKSGF